MKTIRWHGRKAPQSSKQAVGSSKQNGPMPLSPTIRVENGIKTYIHQLEIFFDSHAPKSPEIISNDDITRFKENLMLIMDLG